MNTRFAQQFPGEAPLLSETGFRAALPSSTETNSRSADSDQLPISPDLLYLPDYYERNYAYPLIVWIQPVGSDFHPLQEVMPIISERNYVGLALELDLQQGEILPGDRQFEADPGQPHLSRVEQYVHRVLQNVRRTCHIHSERIFLAGVGAGATAAIQLGLARPEWFEGIISLNGRFPTDLPLRGRFRDLRGKRILLGGSSRDRQATVAETMQAGRLLHSAGMKVTTRIYDTNHQIVRPLLLDIDQWVMRGIATAQMV